MILQALVKHYETLADADKDTRQGWCHAKVSFGINLSKDGDIKGIISLKREAERGKKTVWLPSLIIVPEMVARCLPIFCATILNICWVLMRRGQIKWYWTVFRRQRKNTCHY